MTSPWPQPGDGRLAAELRGAATSALAVLILSGVLALLGWLASG